MCCVGDVHIFRMEGHTRKKNRMKKKINSINYKISNGPKVKLCIIVKDYILHFIKSCVSLLYVTLGWWNKPPGLMRSLGQLSIFVSMLGYSTGNSKIKFTEK